MGWDSFLYCREFLFLNDWFAAFFTLFKFGPQLLGMANSNESVKLISMDDFLDGYLMSRRSRYGKKLEVFELGLQEIRSYFRLFLLSCVILMFMFCTRISKSKLRGLMLLPDALVKYFCWFHIINSYITTDWLRILFHLVHIKILPISILLLVIPLSLGYFTGYRIHHLKLFLPFWQLIDCL